jgi:hypothetical protein
MRRCLSECSRRPAPQQSNCTTPAAQHSVVRISVGGNIRSTTIPTVTASRSTPLLLSVDVPTGEQYESYACVLVTPSGTALWSLPVAGEQAKDTVPIVVPTDSLSHGTYTLVVQGYSKEAGKAAADLAH